MPQNLSIAFCALSPDFMSVRVDDPNAALAALGAQVRQFNREIIVPGNAAAGAAKILIVQRHLMTRKTGISLIRFVLKKDWVLVHEFDDHIDLLPDRIRENFYAAFGLDSFRACHGVQTTGPSLAKYFGEMNAHVRAFPNQIFRYPLTAKPESDKVRIMFAALNRKAAWQPLMAHINNAVKGRRNIEFNVMGDREFFDALETEHKTFSASRSYDDYLSCLHRSDIALMPLDETPQNMCKSDIKFLEAAACGAAAIASPTIYSETIKAGETGLIATQPIHWEHGLKQLIERPGLRLRLSDNANRYVRENRMLMQHIHKRVEWYHELWANRHEVNKRILADFPEISQDLPA